jgi:hypothetical protein
MTEMTSNPFADRLRTAAKEGYMRGYTGRLRDPRPAFTAALASPKQIELITSLLSERDLASETRVAWNARLLTLHGDPAEVAALTRDKASTLITYLFGLPVFEAKPAAVDAVPAGHYALPDDKGGVDFYRVDRPTEGRWAGKVFVSIQHGDDHTTMSKMGGATVLRRIETIGAAECSKLYGRELGKCGVCGRTLTNDESRAAGIGPVCAANAGW